MGHWLQHRCAPSSFSFWVCFPVIISEPLVNLLFWPGLHCALWSKGGVLRSYGPARWGETGFSNQWVLAVMISEQFPGKRPMAICSCPPSTPPTTGGKCLTIASPEAGNFPQDPSHPTQPLAPVLRQCWCRQMYSLIWWILSPLSHRGGLLTMEGW